MKFQMLADKRADEVIAVIVALVVTQRQFLTGLGAGIFQEVRVQLSGEKLIVQALIDQDIRHPAAIFDECGGIIWSPVLLIFP